MSNEAVRFGVSIPPKLLDRFDRSITEQGYTNRSEAIRDLIRDRLVELDWQAEEMQTVGTVTLVYDHYTRELSEKLTELQHRAHEVVVSAMHVHMDAHNCLEVLVVRGKGKDIKSIADKLISTKGVKHGKLVMTTTGDRLV